MSNETTLIRQRVAHKNESLVLTEAALAGQRFVAVLRMVVFISMGAAIELTKRVTGLTQGFDVLRLIALPCYGLYALLLIGWWSRRRSKPMNRNSLDLAQVVQTAIDLSFPTFMSWRAHVVDSTPGHPEMGAAVCSVLVVLSGASLRPVVVGTATALACFTYLVMEQLNEAMMLSSVFFVEAMLFCLGASVAAASAYVGRMFVNLRKRDNLTRFLPAQVAEHAMSLDSSSLAPVQREVTVLFSDIRDFTSLSEAASPREVLELLDEYFADMSQIVKGRDGIVNKFIGDGMLAVWNVPNLDPQHAEKAVRAALDMRTKLVELNAHRAVKGQVPLRIGIGIHTGVVAAGMLGGADQHEYTVIGDAVNVASRIEGLNKPLGTDILVSEVTFQSLGSRFGCRRVGEEHVKGREQPVVVYDLPAAV